MPTELLRLAVERLALGGDGVARHEGKVVFVGGALPGERVEAAVIEQRPRFARARIEHVVQASPLRRDADCVHEQRDGCGGCGFRHVADAASLRLKLEAAMAEVRKLSAVHWPEPQAVPLARLDGCRRRVRLHRAGGKLGLHARGSHRLVAIPHCRALDESLLELIPSVERALAEEPPALSSVQLECDGEGRCFAAFARLGDAARVACESMLTSTELAGFRVGSSFFGEPWIVERFALREAASPLVLEPPRLRELCLVHRAGAFRQANDEANQTIRQRLADVLARLAPKRVVDLYSGSGNLSLVAALYAERICAVDVALEAEAGLLRSAELSGLAGESKLRFVAHDLDRGLPADLLESEQAELVILDPPREGARALIEDLHKASCPHLVYVSCSPATLARDVGLLHPRYEPVELHAFDMFPRTPHLEMLVVLRRTAS